MHVLVHAHQMWTQPAQCPSAGGRLAGHGARHCII